MTAVFGEFLTFSQENGPEVQLKVFGDEFYARYETAEGYSAIYDQDLGLFVYATLNEGRFVSSGIGLDNDPPAGLAQHLEESGKVRAEKAKARFRRK